MTDLEHRLPTLGEMLPPARISLGVRVSDWHEAVVAAGSLLVETGVVEPGYIEAMIRTAEELGPYIVIAPRIAMPHARPEDGALSTGLSLVKLDPPIEFGHQDHDPVILVFGLAAIDKKLHIGALQTLAEMLSAASLFDELMAAETVEEIYSVIRKAEAQVDE